MSTRTFAAGCTISSFFMIVAPSFEMVTLPCNVGSRCEWCTAWRSCRCISGLACRWRPSVTAATQLYSKPHLDTARDLMPALTLSSMTSLSMPRGPSVERTASTTAMQALMLLISCGLPWLVSVPSRSKMIGGCCVSQEHNCHVYQYASVRCDMVQQQRPVQSPNAFSSPSSWRTICRPKTCFEQLQTMSGSSADDQDE